MVAVLQPVSWQRMSDAVAKVRERLLRAAHVLDEAGVPYAVVGGNAVAAWVSRVDESAVRNTRDVDVLLRREDLAAAAAALEKAGFVHRQVASIGKSGHMDVFLDGADAKVRDALHIVFASEKILPDSIAANADVSESEESGEFRLIQLEALVRMKLTAWRDKDRMHLRDLADVGLIDESWPARYSGELAKRLQALLDSPEG
ncbi:nucleotidyl transferase AbiEii/AbiGii toxin family protein [Prosthecobacter sp.]|uniref:nucleotidyl transferase AbiEii/AbiGii toxin family protein n=1 Tax=Prosthecobacter sp. TaxID=1965333 RepID=UPI0037848B08